MSGTSVNRKPQGILHYNLNPENLELFIIRFNYRFQKLALPSPYSIHRTSPPLSPSKTAKAAKAQHFQAPTGRLGLPGNYSTAHLSPAQTYWCSSSSSSSPSAHVFSACKSSPLVPAPMSVSLCRMAHSRVTGAEGTAGITNAKKKTG